MLKRLIILLLFACTVISAQDKTKTNSKVIEAIIFKDRALVKREAITNLSKGKHVVIISNLSSNLKDETVRVAAKTPGVKILDVNVERRFTTDIQQERLNTLQDKLDSLQETAQVIQDNISVLNDKKNFIESLKAESVKNANEKILANTPSTKNWSEMLQFFDNNLNVIYSGLRKQNHEKAEIDNEINQIQREINNSDSWMTKDYKEIVMNAECDDNGPVVLQPSYIVENANWYPIYDARVDSKSKEMELDYFGMINQSTGEDWKNVKLTLSTAEPLTIKTLPQLESWYVDINPLMKKYNNNYSVNNISNVKIDYIPNYGLAAGSGAIMGYIIDKQNGNPIIGANVIINGTNIGAASDLNGKFMVPNVLEGNYQIRVSIVGYSSVSLSLQINEKQTANLIVPLQALQISAQEVVVTGQRPQMNMDLSIATDGKYKNYVPPITNVYAKELSTTFEVPTASTIPSDNNSHKVSIARTTMPVDFEYTCVPKLMPKVYLKGKAVNKNNFPLLEGNINIFMDNDFINRTNLPNIVPNDTIEAALGTDDNISVERRLVNKFVESKGIFGGNKSITYDYEIVLKNNRDSKEKVSVMDQLPIPMNEEIKVTLLTPAEDKTVLNNEKKIEWDINLMPGEKRIIPFKYKVEYPNNINVYGFE